jgi:hypothetical protein
MDFILLPGFFISRLVVQNLFNEKQNLFLVSLNLWCLTAWDKQMRLKIRKQRVILYVNDDDDDDIKILCSC